ncbi:TPR domain protein [Beauveria bassiana ARSEF 2860]|uniref:TPR domain protein n=1 Tax=Beauveria bassiana (strain ARSEF 2860) TaxID=655819 RepID=J5JCG1_BEAB2|nr:TPR domain protein [Beauveria bassiana ARSEF 2860]EJP63713.1 TPR domain protein [Beauveria bassiana ARSEF 2860]
MLPEASGQDPAATSLSRQDEIDRAQMASPHMKEMLQILEKNKQSFIANVERRIRQRFERLDAHRCLALVEIEETREADGSVTAQRLESYPVSISVDFWAHLSAFIRQRVTNQQQVPVRRWIDSAHTVYVEELLHHQFVILLNQCRADMAAFYLQLHQEVASKRVQMCSHARERLQSRETPLTTPELADLGYLDDEEILNDVLRLARESESENEGANYARALEFVQPRLPQPRFEWQTVPLDPHVTRRTTWRVIEESDRVFLPRLERSNLSTIARSIAINQVKLFLLEVLGITNEDISTSRLPEPAMLAKLASLLEVSSLADTLGEKLATALANELQASFTDQNEKLLKDFVLREDDILQPLVNVLVSSVDGAEIANRVSLQARKVLATKNHSEVTRSMEQGFHRISSGRYSWLKELQKLRISNDDMAGLLLDEHEACPWVYYTEVHSDEVQTFERPLLDHHLNGCAHSLLETGETGLGSRLRVAAISNTSSPASFQDIEMITNLHKLCGLAGFLPASRKVETWDNFVVFEEEEVEVARVSFNDLDYSGVLGRTIATLGGLCTAFEKAQHLGLCCNSYTVFCRQREYSHPNIEAFRIQISVAWQLLESLRSVLETPESWDQTASSMLRDHSPLHSALQPLLYRPSSTLFYRDAHATTRKNWLHFCSLAAQFLSLAFLSYTQAHKDELFPLFIAKPLGRVVLCGARMFGGQKIEMATRPLTCIGDMLGTSVISFRLLSFYSLRRDDIGPNRWRKLDIYANLADIVDTWGPAELLCASSDQGPFAMRIGGGILYTEDDHENQYHWSESVDLDKVSQREMDLVGKLLIGAVHVNSGCQSDYGALRRRTRLRTLRTQEQSHRLVFETFGFSLAQLFSVVVQASVKHSAGVSHKKADRETAQHHVMSLLDYWSAVQVSYCTGICQRVRFRDMVADLLCEFGPERVHSVADATAWRQLLATDIVGRLKGDGDVIIDDPVHQELLKVKVKEMYGYLFHSGINDDRTLRVAWPSLKDRHAYCPVHCSGTNAWANLLSESTHISSYAYIAPHCLQAGRGSACQSGWEPATGLSQVRAFATRVQCVNAVKSVAELPHESICFFQLMRIIVFAQVHHPDGEPVLLRVILHTVRASVVRRLIAIWHRTGTTITQVQESRDGATRAEEVLIVCGWDP